MDDDVFKKIEKHIGSPLTDDERKKLADAFNNNPNKIFLGDDFDSIQPAFYDEQSDTQTNSATPAAENIGELKSIFTPSISDADISEIAALSKDDKDKIKSDMLYFDLRTILPLDRQRKGVICPVCGNGSGHTGDGISINVDPNDNHYFFKCWKCGNFNGDLYSIIVNLNNINKSDFNRVLAIGKKIMEHSPINFNLPKINAKVERTPEQIEHDKQFIVDAAKNIEFLPDIDRRALSLETLQKFYCGYVLRWHHPTLPYVQETPRIIIPTSDSTYNAILTPTGRKKFGDKYKSQKVGNSEIFNFDSISADKINIVVEGEIDAMSIAQATKDKYNVAALGGTSNWNYFVQRLNDTFPADNRINLSFAVLLDNDDGGTKTAKMLVDALIQNDYPAAFDVLIVSTEKVDANDILINEGDDTLSSVVDSAIDRLKPKIDDSLKAIEKTEPLFETPKDKKSTTQESIPSCPIDLHLPKGYLFSVFGIHSSTGDNNVYSNVPIVITKKIRDVDSNDAFTEIAFFDRQANNWLFKKFSDDVICDYRSVIKLTKSGISFSQENAKKISKYLVDLPYTGDNLKRIPVVKQFNRTGWTDDSFSKFILPDHLKDGEILADPRNFYKGKFVSKGSYDSWKNSILKIFTDPIHFAPALRLIIDFALSAPLNRIFGVRNSQILLWGSSGIGKSAAAKIAMSAFGDPNKLKNTFDGTPKSIKDLPKKFCDLAVWMDEYQSADERIIKDIRNIVYGYAESNSRARLAQDGSANPVEIFYGTRIMTAEQPILPDNVDAGAFNRLLSICPNWIFSSDYNIAEIHRFFSKNCGHFATFWIDFISNNVKALENQFFANTKLLDSLSKQGNWTNGWADDLAAKLTTRQFVLNFLDPSISFETIEKSFTGDLSFISKDIPKQNSISNAERAKNMLEDFINSHPRNFGKEDNTGKIFESPYAPYIAGYQFNNGAFGFYPSVLNKILMEELGFSSAKAILRAWKDEGLLLPPNNGCTYSCRKKIYVSGTLKKIMLVCFKENILCANVPADDYSD